jgi:3-dehydroquinate synthase
VPNQLLTTPFEHDVSRPPRSTWTVQTEKVISYEVTVERNLLEPDNPTLIRAGARREDARPRRFCIADANVHRLYGRPLREYLRRQGAEFRIYAVDASEPDKTMATALRIVAAMDEFGIDRRREPIIAIGGGVLLDIVGLVSSLYRRHTPYVRVPTTLIGLVDAGVGAKTGVNFGEHKNRLGTYEPPVVALLDRSFIATIDERHISNGLAEVLKIGLVKDATLFALLERHAKDLLRERLQGESPTTEAVAREVLRRAVHGMLEELQPNLWEHTLERIVDYGHSFSPTIEMTALPALLHGEAVTIDMALTTVLAAHRGLVSRSERDRVLAVMAELGLPVWHPTCDVEVLRKALRDTVRHRDGAQRLPLPVGIGGAVFVNDVTDTELAVAVKDLVELSESR